MPRGGKRPGAGRKAGTPNKMTAEIREAALAGGESPLDYMLRVMRDGNEAPDRRDKMAIAAAPFLHSKMAAVEHSGQVDTGRDWFRDLLDEIDRNNQGQRGPRHLYQDAEGGTNGSAAP